MKRAIRTLLSVALAVSLLSAAAPARDAAASGDRNQQLIDGFNGIRGLYGLGWVGSDQCAQLVAQHRAWDMANRGYFSHVTPEGQSVFDLLNAYGCAWRGAGEVLALNGSAYDGAMWTALDQFSASPAHLGIIIGDYTVVGAAIATDAWGTNYAVGIFVLR